MNRTWSWAGAALGAAAAVVLGAGEAAADRIILKKGGQSIEAKSIRYRKSSDEFIVQTDASTMPVPRRDVDRVEVAKPEKYDQAIQLVQTAKYDAAIPLLQEIVDGFEKLEWDDLARDALAQAYAGKADFRKTVSLYKEILASVPPERVTLALRRRYWAALIGAQQYSTLKTELDSAMGQGSREVAAIAQMMRGDMYLAQGQKQDALLDYLRTVVLYEQVKEVQPEALAKAARQLEELRDPRAAELRKKLAAEYPNSPQAKQAAGGS